MVSKKKKTTLVIFDREIELNEFTTDLFHKLILAMISSLRSPELEGTEKIRIEIRK
jgi:hypothetical protein